MANDIMQQVSSADPNLGSAASRGAAPVRKVRRRILSGTSPTLVLAIGWLAFCCIAAVLADILAPYDIAAIDLRSRLTPPVFLGGSFEHWLGTDDLGRDLYSRLLHSIRISIFVALAGTMIGAVIGTSLGFLAAYAGGLVDDFVMLLIDTQAALPFMIVALLVIALFGTSLTLFVIVVGIYGWERYARLARGLALSIQRRGYVTAAYAFGAGPVRVYLRHVLPNAAAALIVNATLNFPETILLESALSFLGLGIQPPMSSLGNMLGYGREYLLSAWWIAVLPGVLIVVTALSVSIIGDALRDRLDPKVAKN